MARRSPHEDLELGCKIVCDKESGATSFITCDKTASYRGRWPDRHPDHAARRSVPAVLHTLTMSDILPRQPPALRRPPAEGRAGQRLATLPEIAETPWGFGPYMVKEWVKGEKIVLEAHPYWFGGTPKTPNFVVSIVTPENAEAQLLGGQVDMLGSETLAGLTETLDAAAKEGKITNIVKRRRYLGAHRLQPVLK